jgi:hypothetical protein
VVGAIRLERLLIGGNARIDALVEPGIVQQERGFDARHVLRCRLAAVEGDGGSQLRGMDRELVG